MSNSLFWLLRRLFDCESVEIETDEIHGIFELGDMFHGHKITKLTSRPHYVPTVEEHERIIKYVMDHPEENSIYREILCPKCEHDGMKINRDSDNPNVTCYRCNVSFPIK